MPIQNATNRTLVEGTLAGLLGGATGDLYCRDPNGVFVRLPVGTSGQFLTVGSGLPSWQTINAAILGVDGKLDSAVLPQIALTKIVPVANQAARLLLTDTDVQPGDGAKDLDTGITWILNASPPSVSGNWISVGDTSITTSDVVSGVFATGRLGGGTASISTWLRGDSQWSALAASDIGSGVFASARLGTGTGSTSTWLRGDSQWSALAASDIGSGVFASARLGTGTANNTTWLRGDGQWAALGGLAAFAWQVVSASAALAVNTGYIANGGTAGTPIVLTLPATAAVGTEIGIAGMGVGGWRVAQLANQQIHFGNLSTTTGTGGNISSTHQRDALRLVCVTANTTWTVVGSQGNLDVN